MWFELWPQIVKMLYLKKLNVYKNITLIFSWMLHTRKALNRKSLLMWIFHWSENLLFGVKDLCYIWIPSQRFLLSWEACDQCKVFAAFLICESVIVKYLAWERWNPTRVWCQKLTPSLYNYNAIFMNLKWCVCLVILILPYSTHWTKELLLIIKLRYKNEMVSNWSRIFILTIQWDLNLGEG